jgi:DNA-binding HxlR family transcriptional regulator/putative sterol carrier protein
MVHVTTSRSYQDGCAVAHALDLVGERWALLVIRELLLGPKRFTDLRAGLPHARPSVLSQRLRELEEADVIRRRQLPPPAASRVYELSEWGKELEPVVLALARWGSRSPFQDPDAPLGVDSIVLGIRTFFASNGWDASYELRLGDDRYRVRVSSGDITVERGDIRDSDAVIETDPATLFSLLNGTQSLATATKRGDVRVTGDTDLVERLLQAIESP